MTDKYSIIKGGHITVMCLDENGNVIDKYENHNLIMDNARIAISKLAAGITGAAKFSKFVLGTQGHNGDYLIPKTSNEGFISSRSNLFSEQSGAYNYPIVFTVPGTASGSCTINSEPNSGSTISINYTGSDVEFTIDIPESAANNTGVSVFTEAALYAGTNIFSMKCFPGKIKDNTVTLRIIWKILF